MVYRVIGLMSGSSMDGLDIAFAEFHETAGKWTYELRNSACFEYSPEWVHKLKTATSLSALDYQLLHAEYGHWLGQSVNKFIADHGLQYQVQLIASHGHTTFHSPGNNMTAQIGDGAAIAAVTGINVVSDLRSMDIALGGQGAPIVPVGEKLLFADHLLLLNLGGIANISLNDGENYIAFDVCPANRVLNALAHEGGKNFDDGGQLAEKGKVIPEMLAKLDALDYYEQPYPKSLSNQFSTEMILPVIDDHHADMDDALRTYVEHICHQVHHAIAMLIQRHRITEKAGGEKTAILVTGGGSKNNFLISRLQKALAGLNVTVEVPAHDLVDFKEAIIMALIGVLRWREENNTFASVTGASRDSIGGAVWIGLEA